MNFRGALAEWLGSTLAALSAKSGRRALRLPLAGLALSFLALAAACSALVLR